MATPVTRAGRRQLVYDLVKESPTIAAVAIHRELSDNHHVRVSLRTIQRDLAWAQTQVANDAYIAAKSRLDNYQSSIGDRERCMGILLELASDSEHDHVRMRAAASYVRAFDANASDTRTTVRSGYELDEAYVIQAEAKLAS